MRRILLSTALVASGFTTHAQTALHSYIGLYVPHTRVHVTQQQVAGSAARMDMANSPARTSALQLGVQLRQRRNLFGAEGHIGDLVQTATHATGETSTSFMNVWFMLGAGATYTRLLPLKAYRWLGQNRPFVTLNARVGYDFLQGSRQLFSASIRDSGTVSYTHLAASPGNFGTISLQAGPGILISNNRGLPLFHLSYQWLTTLSATPEISVRYTRNGEDLGLRFRGILAGRGFSLKWYFLSRGLRGAPANLSDLARN